MTRFSTPLVITSLMVAASDVCAMPDKMGSRSSSDRALFGYGTSEDCLFGSNTRFLPENATRRSPPSSDDTDEDDSKPDHKAIEAVRHRGSRRFLFVPDSTMMTDQEATPTAFTKKKP